MIANHAQRGRQVSCLAYRIAVLPQEMTAQLKKFWILAHRQKTRCIHCRIPRAVDSMPIVLLTYNYRSINIFLYYSLS
jgi:hypothetical protein